MSEVLTCTKCSYCKYADQPCPNCEGGAPVVITATPIFVSAWYEARMAERALITSPAASPSDLPPRAGSGA